jgi:putative tryptophan/tyrosine transport system substrate-binding protein
MRRIGLALVLTIGLLAAPLASDAQQTQAVRVGVLMSGTAQGGERLLIELREGLRELGYAEGQNLVLHLRFAEGRLDRLADLMGELANLRVDVIFGTGPAVVRAAKSMSRTVPIVALDLESDPIEAGFVKSLARPGGNITGIFLDQPELSGKWLELLKDTIPRISRVAVLWDPGVVDGRSRARRLSRVEGT